MRPRASLGAVVVESNRVRGGAPGPQPYKEWFHFCLVGEGFEALLNLSLSAEGGAHVGRAIALVHERGRGWSGEVLTSAATGAAPRHLRIGDSSLRLDGAAQRLVLAGTRVRAALDLRATAVPLVGLGADIADGALSWVVVPRLAADGELDVDGRRYRLRGAPAYHDHNWGAWRWGADFAWQWGFVLGAEHSLVFSRLTDRARSRAFDTKLCVWQGAHLVRVFSGAEVEVVASPPLAPRPLPRFPPVTRLVAGGDAVEVPRRLEVRAARGDAWAHLGFDADDVAELVVPNEADLGFTLIDEACGAVAAEGVIDGRDFRDSGRSIFEFISFT